MFESFMKLADDSVRQMQEAQDRWVASVTAGKSGSAPAGQVASPLIPLQHFGAYHQVLGTIAARQIQLSQGLLAAAFRPEPDVSLVVELVQMQHAVLQRLAQQQTQFITDLGGLLAGITSVPQSNTLSKLLDQEFDFFGQLHALMSDQTTSLVELMESLQMGCGYLVTRKLAGTGA